MSLPQPGVATPVGAGQAWDSVRAAGTVVAANVTTTTATHGAVGPMIVALPGDDVARRDRPAGKGSAAAGAIAPSPAPGDTADLAAAIRRQPVNAAADMPAGDPTVALAALRQRVTAHGAEASAALYGIARIQAIVLGKDAEALRSIDAYARRFPRGKEIADALWLRVRVECRRLSSETCRVAAHSFLRAAPSGTAKAELATRATRLAH